MLLGSAATSVLALSGCGGGSVPAPPNLKAAPSYGQAIRAAQQLIGADAANPKISREALPLIFTHGKPVIDVVVLFHGFTNCPKQYSELAHDFYRRGCNVFVPRLPYHGYADRLTHALEALTIADLQQCALDAFWIARGLGARVCASGLSLGGALCMWLAQNTPIDLAVPVAPFLVPLPFSEGPGSLAAHALYALPDMYWWWDARAKANTLPLYAYPGYPSHTLCELIFFGDLIFAQAKAAKPLARSAVLVTNEHDNAVNNGTSRRVLQAWQRHGAAYTEFTFTDLLPARHDIIDPTTYPQGRTLVYPRLESIVLD